MYLCHEVTALQAMLPAALKAKYERVIVVGEESDEQSLLDMPDLQAIVSFVKSQRIRFDGRVVGTFFGGRRSDQRIAWLRAF